MFLTAIKTWATGKIIPIAFISVGLLSAAAGTFFVLYKLEASKVEVVSQQVVTITEQKKQITAEYEGLQTQLAEEKARHATLEAEQKKTYDDYITKQNDLEQKKKDAARKDAAKKNPKAYEVESQKITNEYMNRMNCLSGNSVSCSKL